MKIWEAKAVATYSTCGQVKLRLLAVLEHFRDNVPTLNTRQIHAYFIHTKIRGKIPAF